MPGPFLLYLYRSLSHRRESRRGSQRIGACLRYVKSRDRADGVPGNSAPRQTNRQLKELNERQDQLAVLDLMTMRSCPAPAHGAPAFYMTSAMQCALEAAKGNTKAEICDISKWAPVESVTPARPGSP